MMDDEYMFEYGEEDVFVKEEEDNMYRQGCDRNVTKSKYEKQNLDTFYWWHRLFKIMEEEIKIPPFRRETVIRDIFPKKILKRILKVLSFVIRDDESRDFSISINSKRASDSDISIPSEFARPRKPSLLETCQAAIEVEAGEKTDADKRDVTSAKVDDMLQCSSQTLKIMSKRRDAGINNPYVRFFNRNPERVAIWRELPPLKLEEMNLAQKSAAVTESIAIDFVDWIVKLGGENATTLDVPQVVKMFEIGFNVHAATSLEAIIMELPSIPKTLSVSTNVHKKWWRTRLHNEIKVDIAAFKKKKNYRAFDTTLPKNIRYTPPKVDETVRWLEIKAPEHLVTMENVWNGITHLRSTRAYCKWLIEHPELSAPKYLRDFGMLDPDFYLQPHYSVETIEGEIGGEQTYLFDLEKTT